MSPTPSPLWPTVWLALALVLAKAAHWSLPEPTASRLLEYVKIGRASCRERV